MLHKLQYLVVLVVLIQTDSFAQVKAANQDSVKINQRNFGQANAIERITELEKTLEYSEFIISSLNTSITIMAILFGILLPLLSYWFVIKPQRELKKTLNKNISKYLNRSRQGRIKNSLDTLLSKTAAKAHKSNALGVLQYEGIVSKYTETEIHQLIRIAENESIFSIKQGVYDMLVYINDEIVEYFFEKQFMSTNSLDRHYANVYFCNFQDNAMNILQKALVSSKERFTIFTSFFGQATYTRSKEFIIGILNSKEIVHLLVETLDIEGANATINNILSKSNEIGIKSEEVTATYIWSKLATIVATSTQHSDAGSPLTHKL